MCRIRDIRARTGGYPVGHRSGGCLPDEGLIEIAGALCPPPRAGRNGVGRWTEATIVDPARFYRAYPEAVVTEQVLDRLAPDIAARARALDQDGIEQEEIRAEIRARIVECAASYRRFDESGQPVFDYLDQHPSYIVQHAAIPSYSRLRKERRGGFASIRIDRGWEDADGDIHTIEIADDNRVEPLDALLFSELHASIGARLEGPTATVFRLIVEGLERSEIAEQLSLDRRRVHEHVAKIRIATTAALLERDAGVRSGLALSPALDRFPDLVCDGDAGLGGEPAHPLPGLAVDDVASGDEAATAVDADDLAKPPRQHIRVARRKRLELVEEHAERLPDEPALLPFAA